MSLDVRLTRDINERWGFELIGGADEGTTLTVQKLQTSSPAVRAGLQDGDVIITINGEEAIDFSNEEACRRIAECGETLIFGLMRGLYDPVLDDQEPVYYEPGDLDLQSQPTEVPFQIQKFLEPEDLGSSIINCGSNGAPSETPYDPSVLLFESRSLTASPFIVSTKPYRPFSTEPIPEVPALEDPIILNPNYKDQFGKGINDIIPDYLLNAYSKNKEGKFKLPISEQYDPEGTKQVKNAEIDSVLSKYSKMEMLSKSYEVTEKNITSKISKDIQVKEKLNLDNKNISKDEKITESSKTEAVVVKENRKKDTRDENIRISENIEIREEKLIKNGIKYIDETKQNNDITQLKNTALSIVEDSIERALLVTEEIEKEMKEEKSSEIKFKSETEGSKEEETFTSGHSKTQSNNYIKTEEMASKLDKNSSRKEHVKDETNLQKKEMRNLIEKREELDTATEMNKKIINESKSRNFSNLEETSKKQKNFIQDNQHSDYKREFKTSTNTSKGTNSERLEAEKRMYATGLQTIPNIRGLAHSSYHYELLLRTFFIHLTDVMVALSRFILTQPIFNASNQEMCETESGTETYKNSVSSRMASKKETIESISEIGTQMAKAKMNTEGTQKETVPSIERNIHYLQENPNTDPRNIETIIQVDDRNFKKRELVTPIDFKETETLEIEGKEQIIDKKTITSGSQMAQRTERKLTKDMTQKIDSIVSEFQRIAVEGDSKEMFRRNRRSRSRSQIEEEVATESDPLEWLSKVDNQKGSQEINEERLTQSEYSSLETIKRKHVDKQEIKHKSSKSPKQTYVAVVEAHVYTNKDLILEDVAEFSETSSIESTVEVNTAFEAESISTENVMDESAVQHIKHLEKVGKTQKLERVNTESATTVRDVKESVQKNKLITEEEFKIKGALQHITVQENVFQELNETFTPEVNTKESTVEETVAMDFNESLFVSESSAINIEESASELQKIEIHKETIIGEDYRLKGEVKSKAEVTEYQITEIGQANTVIRPEVQIEDISENVVVKSQTHNVGEEYAALEIKKEVAIEVESLNLESEEFMDVSQNIMQETTLSQEFELDETEVTTEKSVVSSDVGLIKSEVSTESILEMTSETENSLHISNHSQISNNKSVSHFSDETIQDSSFTAQPIDKKLTLRTDLNTLTSLESPSSTIDTPTPSTVPPTPLTDEYVFKLTIPLPKSRGSTPIPRDCTPSPEDEDPHIVKKKLVPHIETTIEKVIYDPPLASPPGDKVQSPIYKIPGLFGGNSKTLYKPVYRKPGLFGGADNPEYAKEEIREIERKSSLLASAIDETIKSIEEYKEEVGIEKKKDIKISNSYQECNKQETAIETKQNGFMENGKTIEEIENGEISTANNNKEFPKTETETSLLEVSEPTKKVVQIVSKEATVKEVEIQIIANGTNKNITDKTEGIKSSVTPLSDHSEVKVNGHRESESACDMEEVFENKINIQDVRKNEEKKDPMLGFRTVVFEPESIQKYASQIVTIPGTTNQEARQSPYITDSGEIIGTFQGIVDGLDAPILDEEISKELGKPGLSEEKIAELISGEAEMLREAHVMGLSRVLTSHMHRADDSSVDFQKIKPMIGSLKDSEVLKALNEELARQKEEQRKKEEKKWTTFLQKPKRPVPKAKFGYHGWTEAEPALVEEPYKVKIVKQSKPKVAPDYKPEDFETGPLPWEERARFEESLPPIAPEEPILIPEIPEYLEAVDPLTESEVPDLEDTGLPLPLAKDPSPPPEEPIQEVTAVEEEQEQEVQQVKEVIEEKKENSEDMESRLAEQLVKSVQSMVDPNATIEQQLCQMRAQLAALAQLPEVIQQTLELVSKQLNKMTHQEANIQSASHVESHDYQVKEESQNHVSEVKENHIVENGEVVKNHILEEKEIENVSVDVVEDNMETGEKQIVPQERRLQTPQMTEDELKLEKMKKAQDYKDKLESQARQIKQRATPRVGKPKRMFGPLDPDSRPVVLPGGRRWRKTEDVYNEQFIAETLQAQSELLLGKTMGFESDLLPYDDRINFMKYEKPPVTLDHLQNSETYKLVHDMDQPPLKRVEMLTPVIAEADYRERCRSMTPSGDKKHLQIPHQFHP